MKQSDVKSKRKRFLSVENVKNLKVSVFPKNSYHPLPPPVTFPLVSREIGKFRNTRKILSRFDNIPRMFRERVARDTWKRVVSRLVRLGLFGASDNDPCTVNVEKKIRKP